MGVEQNRRRHARPHSRLSYGHGIGPKDIRSGPDGAHPSDIGEGKVAFQTLGLKSKRRSVPAPKRWSNEWRIAGRELKVSNSCASRAVRSAIPPSSTDELPRKTVGTDSPLSLSNSVNTATDVWCKKPQGCRRLSLERTLTETSFVSVTMSQFKLSSSNGKKMKLLTRYAPLRKGLSCLVLMAVLWATTEAPSDAILPRGSSIDEISQEFTLRITNPVDNVSLASSVFIEDAGISTAAFGGVGVPAPKGEIYLSFTATSSPEQDSSNQADSGHFFSEMTPLAPSSVIFTSGTGRRVVAKEFNPINQANNPDADSDDGLLDATYWFTVPSNTRAGTISIGPATTRGCEYRGFWCQALTPLNVSESISFTVSFPRELTTPPKPQAKTASPPLSSSFAVNDFLTVVPLLFFGYVFWRIRRRSQRRA